MRSAFMASRRAKGGPSEFQTFVTNSQEQTKREESHSHLQVAFRVHIPQKSFGVGFHYAHL